MKHFLVLALAFTFIACGERQVETQLTSNDDQAAFFANVADLCGETFAGQSTFPDNQDHALVGTELRTHISSCSEDIIRIDLYRDTDYWHGTWVLERREQGLHLFHDHLGDERTEEYLIENNASHGYGGYATTTGSATQQFFPADDVTAEMIPDAATNQWMMQLDLEAGTFTYFLERHGEPRFRAVLSHMTEE